MSGHLPDLFKRHSGVICRKYAEGPASIQHERGELQKGNDRVRVDPRAVCVCCSFEHFVIATGVSYISAGFSTKSISSASVFRLSSALGERIHHHRLWGPEFDSPSRPPTSVLFGEPRHSPNRYQDVQLHTTSASELPVMGPTEILACTYDVDEAPPRRSYTFGFPALQPMRAMPL